MSDVIVPILCALLPVVAAGLAASVSRWRCRATALDELTILSHIDADSVEAAYIRELLSRRLRTWWQRETAGTGTHVAVTLTCVALLYLLTVAGWAGNHLLRSHELGLAEATRAGDLAARGREQLAVDELVAAGQVLTLVAYIVIGLGVCHALFWLGRGHRASRRWAETPYRVPAGGLLRVDHAGAVRRPGRTADSSADVELWVEREGPWPRAPMTCGENTASDLVDRSTP